MTKNLLTEWKLTCDVHSTSLITTNEYHLARCDVDFVYNVLIDFFGIHYFDIKVIDENKKLKLNWLHSLLIQPNIFACIAKLYEVAISLKSLSSEKRKIYENYKNDPQHLQNFLFEQFVCRLLSKNGFSTTTEFKEINTPIDVLATFHGITFNCECKKLYVNRIKELTAKFQLLEFLTMKIKNLVKVQGIIGTIKLNKNLDLKPHDSKFLDNWINESIDKLNLIFKNLESHYNYKNFNESSNSEWGEIVIVEYSDFNKSRIEAEGNYDLIFYIDDNLRSNFIQTELSAKVETTFSVLQSEITGKIINTIIQARNQHQYSRFQNKMIFIDSEMLPDINVPLFINDQMLDIESTQIAILKEARENEIVCLIQRNYMKNIPTFKLKAYGINVNPQIKIKLERLNFWFDFKFRKHYTGKNQKILIKN